jgi:dTDP-4-amino-4,6-dideoxygalactose transaminase
MSAIPGGIEPFAEPVYVTRPFLPPFERVQSRLADIWASRRLSNMGPQHDRLQAELAAHLGVPDLRLFSNGTLALQIALMTLGIRGEVLTTPFTFSATVHAIALSGARPVFCDIDPETLCIDPRSVERMIGDDVAAVLGVHVYGTPCDVDALTRIADAHHLKLVFDAAHAFGTTVQGRPIGLFGDMTMFSFHATKLFHTAEGGGLAFADATLSHKLELMRNFGIENEDEVVLVGTNAKLNEIQAAIGLEVLGGLEGERSRRSAVKAAYVRMLENTPGIRVVQQGAGVSDSLQYVVIRVDEAGFGMSRDGLWAALKQWNVFTRRYFYPLCSDYPSYMACRRDRLEHAERAAQEVLCLPMFGDLGVEGAERIAGMINYLCRRSWGLPRQAGAATDSSIA